MNFTSSAAFAVRARLLPLPFAKWPFGTGHLQDQDRVFFQFLFKPLPIWKCSSGLFLCLYQIGVKKDMDYCQHLSTGHSPAVADMQETFSAEAQGNHKLLFIFSALLAVFSKFYQASKQTFLEVFSHLSAAD